MGTDPSETPRARAHHVTDPLVEVDLATELEAVQASDSYQASDHALFTSIMAGASGYVLKNVHGNDLVEGIHQVARGQSLLDPAVTTRVLARLRGDLTPSAGEPGSDLIGQERKVLNLVAEGLTNRQIGERVHLAEKTVKNFVSNLLMKLLSRRAEVAAYMAKRRRSPGGRQHQLALTASAPAVPLVTGCAG